VHLVAHSMGGLVSRTMIARHPDTWKRMAPGRLVMLGTPNYGSFAIPQLFSGLNDSIKKLALVDPFHGMDGLLLIARHFIGAFQMMPSTSRLSGLENLYAPQTYHCQPQATVFDIAKDFQKVIENVIEPGRMCYVAGWRQVTANGIQNWSKLGDSEGYNFTMAGDGTVSHNLGLLDGVSTFFVEDEHAALPQNKRVLQALPEIIRDGKSSLLPDKYPGERGAETQDTLRAEYARKISVDQLQVEQLKARVQATRAANNETLSPEEEKLKDLVLEGFAAPRQQRSTEITPSISMRTGKPGAKPSAAPTRKMIVNVVVGDIGKAVTKKLQAAGPPIDLVSVGHYNGVPPQRAEEVIDKAVSSFLPRKNKARGVITDLTFNGAIKGDLGQLFFLPSGSGERSDVVIAGLGFVGRFGRTELEFLSRQLVAVSSQLGKKHLGTVLIGSGDKNLTVFEAAGGWVRGMSRVISDTEQESILERVTFVEKDQTRADQLKAALLAVCQERNYGVQPDFPAPESVPPEFQPAAGEIRLFAELQGNVYRFGALTSQASYPEREIAVDPNLILEANETVVQASDADRLSEVGEFMFKLLVPTDFSSSLMGSAPVVLSCDTNVARIHWELLRLPQQYLPSGNEIDQTLALGRGFTRQLRTTLAPPPEPLATFSKNLRVLVVADPAPDMPLVGARQEGAAVRDLFKRMQETFQHNGISRELVSLFGPTEATRVNVMQMLLREPAFDVFHFAGHCYFDRENFTNSGFLFSQTAKLTSKELARIDRMPRFVFANACESGVTPGRPELRSAELAPSFAEAFFARGVGDFVCTAWPIDDEAARTFALKLYSSLLGQVDTPAGVSTPQPGRGALQSSSGAAAAAAPAPVITLTPKPMYEAMRCARESIARMPDQTRTWGAYQHYGSPHFHLIRVGEQNKKNAEPVEESEAPASSSPHSANKRAHAAGSGSKPVKQKK